ncbi:MAG: hypothetical protein CMO97_05075 [Woeseia sp.]|nr:hypothetical protein [Woeseia sp.]|tara:strand:+ start:843 stop:1079 length:237 start_codon:yes stop_codon:yes gene_type:complete
MTVAQILKMLAKMPQEMEVAVETPDGFSEVYDCEVDKEKSYKLAVDYSGDYHELKELDNHEVGAAIRIPGLVILKPAE